MTTPEAPQKENEFEKLRTPVQEIIAFTNTLDEHYREKCFEVLLDFYLHKDFTKETPAIVEVGSMPKAEQTGEIATLPLTIRAFLTQNGISESAIGKLFLMEKGEVVPIYKITETKKAVAQIQLALLTALRNALINPATMFEFSIDDVRQLCKEHNVYDTNNFSGTFNKNASLFVNLDTDEEHVKLSPEGKTELAEIIVAVSKQ